jgi:hypothetical protein
MPMHRGRLWQVIVDVDPNAVALSDVDARTGDHAVVGVGVDGHARQDRTIHD